MNARVSIVKPTPLLLGWMQSKIGPDHGYAPWNIAETQCAVLFGDDNTPVAAAAFYDWTPHSCNVTIVAEPGKRWATQAVISDAYYWLFAVRGVNRLASTVAATNIASIRLTKALGYTQEGSHRDFYGPGKHAISYSFLREDWANSRWHRA